MTEKGECRAVAVADNESLLQGGVEEKRLEIGACAFKHAQKSAVALPTRAVGDGRKIEIVDPIDRAVARFEKDGKTTAAQCGLETDAVFTVAVGCRQAVGKALI